MEEEVSDQSYMFLAAERHKNKAQGEPWVKSSKRRSSKET